ncbi:MULTISPECIES: class I SAM-dependent methyltransferase [Rhodococcus]|uniref:methyltransferase domain-containing protein n=1 Tax=Rhodococcus sp. A14 TaxID=1194106 RepID=UPI0010641B39|nr:class I SAM-dependent methyltransferase [Rhodococcus sp. A14]
MTTDRRTLRSTFELAAGKYHAARPGYPSALYDELVLTSRLRLGDSLLEIGGGTGKATVELARRGFTITSVELGHDLAAIARENVAPFPHAEVVCADFEQWRPAPGVTYDLVFAATSWHWIDPSTRYIKAASLIRPEGHLAFWGAQHVFPEGGDPIFRDIQPVYEEIGEGLPDAATWPRPGELADHRAEMWECGLFDNVVVRHFDWEVSYDVDGYLGLLDTFSGHIAMAKWQRERLYSEIRRRIAERPDHRIRRHFGAVLHIARRRS